MCCCFKVVLAYFEDMLRTSWYFYFVPICKTTSTYFCLSYRLHYSLLFSHFSARAPSGRDAIMQWCGVIFHFMSISALYYTIETDCLQLHTVPPQRKRLFHGERETWNFVSVWFVGICRSGMREWHCDVLMYDFQILSCHASQIYS